MSLSAFVWGDGWSPDHACHREQGHGGDHLCKCDAFLSQWMALHGQEVLAEQTAADEEAERLRLRAELEAQQTET